MECPEDLWYTSDHEWIRVDGHEGTIGITDFAQDYMGDIVFVQLPELGQSVSDREAFGAVESVKAVSDLFSPCSGVVIAVNETLGDDPGKVNASPYGEGWMIRIRLDELESLEHLMNAVSYQAMISGGVG